MTDPRRPNEVYAYASTRGQTQEEGLNTMGLLSLGLGGLAMVTQFRIFIFMALFTLLSGLATATTKTDHRSLVAAGMTILFSCYTLYIAPPVVSQAGGAGAAAGPEAEL